MITYRRLVISAMTLAIFTASAFFNVANAQTSSKMTTPHFSTYENNISVLWDKYTGSATFNAYAVFMKKGSDFTTSDLTIGMTPYYASANETQYTFGNLENGTYYFKVGIGTYENGRWTTYGNTSDSISYTIGGNTTTPTPTPSTTQSSKMNTPYFSTYENNIGVIWSKYTGSATFNAYAVFMKKDSDFTTSDLTIGITPYYVPANETQYTFNNLSNGNYYFKVGVGTYENGRWVNYGNTSDTINYTLSTSSATTTPTPTPTPTTTTTKLPPAGYEDEVLTQFASNPFPDTTITALEGKAAAELYRRAVIGGFPDGEFKGSRFVNRAEAAKFLLLTREIPVGELTNNGRFWDVKEGEWYVKYIMTAAQKGIINGYPDGSFKPADTVNTAEFLKMLTLTFDLPKNLSYSYIDVKPEDWFTPYAGIAQKYNLFPTRPTNELQPGTYLTRDEVAVAIYQFLLNR